ncbi:uncharacterized protein LOC144317267 [Canis aureus]
MSVESGMLPTLLGGGARSSCPSESCQCIFSGCLPSLPPSRAGGLNPGALEISWSSKLYRDAAWMDSDPECSFPSSPKAQSWSFPAAGCAPGAVGAGAWRPLPFTGLEGEMLTAAQRWFGVLIVVHVIPGCGAPGFIIGWPFYQYLATLLTATMACQLRIRQNRARARTSRLLFFVCC